MCITCAERKTETVYCMHCCVCPLGDSPLDVAYPDILVLLGGGVELVHLRRGGITNKKHASFLTGYVPHYQLVKG